MTEETYKKICSRFPKGVTVVTARRPGDKKPIGMTVSAFTGVSLKPPTVLICLNRNSRATGMLLDVPYFVVNVLSEDQRDVSQQFATHDIETRFQGLDWREGLHGVPVLSGTLGHFVCVTEKMMTDGDHHVIFGRVLDGEYCEGPSPLVYWASGYQTLNLAVSQSLAG